MRLLLLFSIIVASAFAKKPVHNPPPPPPACGPQSVSLTPSNWIEEGSYFGRNQNPSALSGGGFYLNFPDYSTRKYIGYLTTVIPCGVAGSSYLTMTLKVVTTGTPVFKYDSESFNTCVSPAAVRPYFESRQQSWTNTSGDTFRWWSNPISYVLTGGQITLTIPLTPDQWSTVYGRSGNADAETLAGFQTSLQATQIIGMTFGGGCFFGHGVNVQGGTAQFQVLSFSTF